MSSNIHKEVVNLAVTEGTMRSTAGEDNDPEMLWVGGQSWGPNLSFPTCPASPSPPRGWSVLAQQPFPGLSVVPVPLTYLGLGAARLSQTLTGHLNCLVCSGKLRGLYQPLLSSLAIGVRDANQICSLGREKRWGEE